MTTTQIDTKDLTALIAHARHGADDLARQIIDGIVERTRPPVLDFPIRCFQLNGDWTLSVEREITDEQARALTFRAAPKQVVLGAFVQVIDGGGTRTGRLVSATHTYSPHSMGTAYVVCGIDLR